MIDFAPLESPTKEQPRFTIEPKDHGTDSEASRQAQFRDMLRFVAPGVTSWSTPNAGKRGYGERAKAKKEGMTAGVADEAYAWNHGICFLEWKAARTMPSPEQIAWLNKMVDRGFRVACVRSPAFALELFREWGVPLIDRRGI